MIKYNFPHRIKKTIRLCFILLGKFIFTTILFINLIIIGCQPQNEKNQYLGCWEDAKGSKINFLDNIHVEMRLFDLLNADKLREDEIVEFPINMRYSVSKEVVYRLDNFKIDDKPAVLLDDCKSSFVPESTEPIVLEMSSEGFGRVRLWGQRKIDAFYEVMEKGITRIYVVVEIEREVIKPSIARTILLETGSLVLEVDGIGKSFFELGRTFKKCEKNSFHSNTNKLKKYTISSEESEPVRLSTKKIESSKTSRGETVTVRHILISAPPSLDDPTRQLKLAKAKELHRKLLDGADFSNLAIEYSDCPSKKNGGLLDPFGRGVMVKTFEEAAFHQKLGEIGPVIETLYGYNIIQVLENEDTAIKSFEETTFNQKLDEIGPADEQLSQKRYIDPKGYFKIVPPAGWRIQEYPQDQRGKVAFIGPGSNIDLRVLVNAVDFSTIEELIAFCKNVEKRIRTNTNIKRINFDGRSAVERTFEFKGQKLYYIDFLVGKVDHNLAFSASANKYNNYHSVVMKSMETYEPILHDVSDQEVIKHVVAKKFRLGQLMIQNGSYELALEFVKEGLEVSPTDPNLLKLKQQIEYKIKNH
ncbi:MAG: peptidylprolyl isomerase [Deltaproteobacteria bacterium]|nr:peptidylprolyl isomerase [Deltaproteobacteria bacterium]